MAVPVTKTLRDVFYKHRASGMLEYGSLSWSLFFAESPYLMAMAFLYSVVFYWTVQIFPDPLRFFYFWVFFVINLALYSYFGQAFMCLVKDIPTAGALQGALIGTNVFFSGLVVRPQYFVGAFQIGYWFAPGRYAYEGLIVTQFNGMTDPVTATTGSPYFYFLGCSTSDENEEPCVGTMEQFVSYFYGGKFTYDQFWLDIGVLLGFLVVAKLATHVALWKFNYVNT
jgi:hypothetical protein